jgi:hypothetical protein
MTILGQGAFSRPTRFEQFEIASARPIGYGASETSQMHGPVEEVVTWYL